MGHILGRSVYNWAEILLGSSGDLGASIGCNVRGNPWKNESLNVNEQIRDRGWIEGTTSNIKGMCPLTFSKYLLYPNRGTLGRKRLAH